MRKAFQTKKTQKIDEKWLTILHPNFEGVQGEVLVSFELLTKGTPALADTFHITIVFLSFSLLIQRNQKNFPMVWGEKAQINTLNLRSLYALA